MSIETIVKEKPILFSGPMVRAILEGKKTHTRRVVKGNFAPDQFIREKSGSGYGWNQANWQGKKSMWLMTGPVGIARDAGYDTQVACPYGKPGDRLWVKTGYTTRYDAKRNETHWKTEGGWITTHGQAMSKTGKPKRDGGHPGRFMPKWLSQEFRLPALEITDIRVQRLQEISEEDAIAEGFSPGDGSPVNGFNTESPYPAMAAFAGLWEELNGKRGVCKTCKGHGVVPAWSGSVSGGSLAQDAKDCIDCKGESRGYGWDANPFVWCVSFKRVEESQ